MTLKELAERVPQPELVAFLDLAKCYQEEQEGVQRAVEAGVNGRWLG